MASRRQRVAGRMARALAIAALALLAPFGAARCATAGADEALLPQIAAAIDAGQFSGAEEMIARALGTASVDTQTRSALEFQRERMRRIRLDFPLTEEQIKYVAKQVLASL